MKRYLVLLGVSLLMGLAWVGTAAAQVTFTVTGVPVPIRSEGLTEATGPVVLTATSSGTIVTNTVLKFKYFQNGLPATIANATLLNGETDEVTCAGPAPPASCAFPISVSGNEVDYTFGAGENFVAGDTFALADERVSGTFGAGGVVTVTVQAFVPTAFDGTNPVSFFGGNVATVATVQAFPSVSVSTGTPTPGFLSCAPQPISAAVTITENFGDALTSQADENTLADEPTFPPGTGTEVTIKFANVPIGIQILAPATVSGTPAPLVLALSASTTNPQVSASGAQDLSFTYVVGTGGSPTTLLTVNQSAQLDFGVTTTATYVGGVGTVTASVSLDPRVPPAAPTFISFAPNTEGSGTSFAINPCETDLLFPFLANTFGFDTGIAIANTTTDPWNTPIAPETGVTNVFGGTAAATPANGTCQVEFFPSTNGTSPGTPVQFPITVNSGGTGTVVLSTTPAAGLQGYAIARCNFLNAHAFAFIDNPGATGGPNLAEGYVALVIQNPVLIPRTPINVCVPFINGFCPPSGEQLNN